MPAKREPEAVEKDRFLTRMRYAAAGATLFVIVVYVLGDAFTLPFLRGDYHADPAILLALLSFFGVLIGVEILAKLPALRPREDDTNE